MKKNYIKPCTNTITIQQNLLQSNSINLGGSKGTYNSSMGQLSREGSSWDDDEEQFPAYFSVYLKPVQIHSERAFSTPKMAIIDWEKRGASSLIANVLV